MKRIFNVMLLLLLFFMPMSAFATTLKFAQISDIHYNPDAPKPENSHSFKIKYYALPVLDDAISHINEDKTTKFVLVTGDAADRPLVKDFEFMYNYINKNLKKPWYYCLGNHDVAVNGELTKKKHIELLSKINPNGFSSEKTYYTFKPQKDMTFICLDAVYDTKRTAEGYLPPEQLSFLDKTLNSAKDDVVVIFLHHPTVYPTLSNDHDIVNLYAINDILKKYNNPILILGGHFHANKIRQTNNIVEVASPSLTSYPIAYRYITIDNNSKRTTFDIDYVETTLSEVQNIAKSKISWSTAGKETDRKNIITIYKNSSQNKNNCCCKKCNCCKENK
jgi:3',5'-cyclic AMP phosphodiesterase CpdA